MAKIKIGELYNKPIVKGDKNLVENHEIYVDDLINGSQGGSTTNELKRNDVNFFDYDGTLLYAYSWEEAKNLKALPALPKHEGLEVREWNYTLDDIKEQGTENTIGKADIGACVYDEEGNQVTAADVLIFERGCENIDYYCGDYWDKDAMVFNLISIPNTVTYIYFSEIIVERLVIPIGIELKEYYGSIYGNILKEFWQNGYDLPLYTNCMKLPQVFEVPNTFSKIGDGHHNFLQNNQIIYMPNTIDYISRFSGYDDGNGYNSFIIFKEHEFIPVLNTGEKDARHTIIVPDELYSEWRTATNWSSMLIYKISEFPYFNK